MKDVTFLFILVTMLNIAMLYLDNFRLHRKIKRLNERIKAIEDEEVIVFTPEK